MNSEPVISDPSSHNDGEQMTAATETPRNHIHSNTSNTSSDTHTDRSAATESTRFRFILASDLHLEQPPMIPDGVPDWLRQRLLESCGPRLERLVDVAIAQRVDAVLLAGDLLHPKRGGPRMLLFLIEQFQRLDAKKIPIYWASGEVDQTSQWPDVGTLRLPENVHIFPEDRFRTFYIGDATKARTRIVGIGRGGVKRRFPRQITIEPASEATKSGEVETSREDGKTEWRKTETRKTESGRADDRKVVSPVTIALFWGPDAPRVIGRYYLPQLRKSGDSVDFWALGGRHRRGMRRLSTMSNTGAGAAGGVIRDTILHYPGTPQGQRPEQTGVHGVSLVEIDPTQTELRRRIRVSLIPIDPVRWMTEELRLEPGISRARIEQRMRERLRQIVEISAETSIMVSWRILADVATIRTLRRGLAEELLKTLRADARIAAAVTGGDTKDAGGKGSNSKDSGKNGKSTPERKGAANFVWNVAVDPVLVGATERILTPGKESMLRDFLAEMRQIQTMAFPDGTPYDPEFDEPLIAETFDDTENDFDPDNDLAIDDERREAETVFGRDAESKKSTGSRKCGGKTPSKPVSDTVVCCDGKRIAEQFPLLDEYLELSTLAEVANGDAGDENAPNGHDDADSDTAGGMSAEPAAALRASGVDPVLWRQWIGRAARWDESPQVMREILREASLLGVDLLDHDDDFHDAVGDAVGQKEERR